MPTPSALLAIEYVPTSSLSPNPKNPRRHDAKQVRQIARSIEQFGFNSPILVDAALRVIAGHGRLEAIRLLKRETVPIIRLEHLSEAQRIAYTIADNRLVENSTWNERLLGEHFKSLSEVELNFDLELTGFSITEIDLLLEEFEIAEGSEPDGADVLPEEVPEAISMHGDLWQLGRHRLLCGDALEALSYEILMAGQQADLVLTDPPYNMPIQGHVSGLGKTKHREFAMASGEMTEEQFTAFLKAAMLAACAHSVDGALGYWFIDWRHLREILAAGQQAYTDLLNVCVWNKDNAGMGSFYRSGHELIFVFRTGRKQHRNNIELGRHGRNRSNVWSYPNATSFSRTSSEGNLISLHPTVKPVAMIADAILDCTVRGGVILDPFLGSGTTLIAAEKTGRTCLGIELDPLYVDVIVRRWEAYTGLAASHAKTGAPYRKVPE